MPALSAPQLALLRAQSQTSQWYCLPVPPVTVFSAQVNSAGITVGAVVIPYDNASGAFADVLQGMTCLVGSAPGLSDYGILRIRIDADATNLYVAWNSDVAWADNLYLTVYEQFLAWSVRQRIVPPVIYKDYNIAYTEQTSDWPPIALMGDNVCKFFTGNPTNVVFPISGVPVAAGATIVSYAIDFGDGSTSSGSGSVTHGYAAAGTYYATLTVTDSNGKTHLTRRIVCLADFTSVYTVNFEGTSLEGAVDDGWTAKIRVFDPNADTAHFPERAPCFIISGDSYGGTAGSVGFPANREPIVFFGYIVEDSVAIQPEYNEITFDLESIAGVMGRADSPPVYLGDSANPAGEPDAWAWGTDLNVFRGLVYLLKFHSTVMDIADVNLYNDTTLTKAVDYPADSLWNMLLQFAKGKRLMRASVTRAGTVVVGRDPNLVPIASRGAFTTVMQLAQGDWRDQVTAPQKPYPITSFICISGLTYDGVPADEPNPVFGMSPGRPPKDYGAEREIQYLKLVDQVECNTLAGLLLGTDNMPFGDIVIPMRGNWVKCFDPALQEYVQTPSGGWVTKRGTLLDSVKLIVRKVSVTFDWNAGVMTPTLTCDYYSFPEIGVNGDCFPPDAPPPPQQQIPPIIPGPHPVPTNGANLDVWTLFSSGDIYRLSVIAPSSGTVTSKPNWKTQYGSGALSPRDPRAIAPSLGLLVNVLSNSNTTENFDVQVQHSSNDAGAYTTLSINPLVKQVTMRRDPQSLNIIWLLVIEISDTDLLKASIFARSGGPQYDNTTIVTQGLTDYVADTGAVRLYRSTNGGASFSTGLFLDYVNQLWATQMVGTAGAFNIPYPNPPHDPDPPFSGQTFNITYLPQSNDDMGDGANIWSSRFTTDDTWGGGNWVGWDARLGGATVGVNGAGSSPQDPLGYWYYHNTNIAGLAVLLEPVTNPILAPNGTGAHVFALVSGYQVSKDLQSLLFGTIICDLKLNPAIQNPSQSPIQGFDWPGDWNYEAFYTYAYKVPTSGSVTSSRQVAQAEFSGSAGHDRVAQAVCDLLVADFVYTLTENSYFVRWSYVPIVISFTYASAAARLASSHTSGDLGKFAFQTDTATIWKLIGTPSTWEYINGAPVDLNALFGSAPVNLFCTTQGTILVGTADGHVHRTTDRGQTWTDIAITGVTFGTFWCTESHGVIGGAGGPLVVPIGTTGKYVFSLNDGASWAVSADITAHSAVLSNYAR